MFGKKPIDGQDNDSKDPSKNDELKNSSDNIVNVTIPDNVDASPDSSAQLPSIIEGSAADDSNDIVQIKRQSLDTIRDMKVADKKSAVKYVDSNLETPGYIAARSAMIEELVDKVDFAALQTLSPEVSKARVLKAAKSSVDKIEAPLNAAQIELLYEQVLDELLGLGPLEPLLNDPDIADIMINTFDCVYVEKNGQVYRTDIKFQDEEHLKGIIQRIVARVGRRVDESSPMVDARLADGSRFNAIIPPLALDGALVSIRKFKQHKMPLKEYVNYNSMTPEMCRFLEICGKIRLNILISGGTGSGKTTLLNALSGHIDQSERVITIEDAAELQLHQPHVLRLETRPASIEGTGEVTQRELVKNALRMRPDRIILGEIRGDEVIDVLTAMNTGHDGSMATIHSNSPRDCLSRIENLVGMSGVKVPEASLRYQIASAVNLIVQLQRMRDGRRRITHIEEVVGMEGTIISTQTIFQYKMSGINADGELQGNFECSGIRPRFISQAEYYGLANEMSACLGNI